MDTPTILVIDSDPKNLQILKESLESSNFKVVSINNGIDAWGIIQQQKPDLIVCEVNIPGLNGFELQAKMQKSPITASIPLVFLTNNSNPEDRQKSLRAGVKDYMIKPLHVKEVIARLQMILRRLDRIKNEESESNRNVVGRLEDKSVEDLVESYGLERRTGVLSLYDNNNVNGEIYFRDGTVVNARLGNFKAEKAVYQMLPWKHGHFVMTFKDINVEDEITVSNLGLLLQGLKRLQDREKFIKQLPSLDAVFVKTTIFEQILKKKTVSSDAEKFITLFDGKRTISNIMAESIYDDLKTLEKITKLYQQGFIQPLGIPNNEQFDLKKVASAKSDEQPFVEKKDLTIASKSKFQPLENKQVLMPEAHSNIVPTPQFPTEEEIKPAPVRLPDEKKVVPAVEQMSEETAKPTVNEFSSVNGRTRTEEVLTQKVELNEFVAIYEELFNGRSVVTGQLAIISSNSTYRKDLVSTLTNGVFSAKSISLDGVQSIELGKIVTPAQHKLEILGLSTERKFIQMLDKVAASLVGYIVLVVGDHSSNFGYLAYLINSLKKKFTVPHVVAVYQPTGKKSIPLDVIRYSLKMDEIEQIVDINVQNMDSIKYLLKQLKPPDKQ